MTDTAAFDGFDIAAPPDELEIGGVYEATLTGFKPFSYTDPGTNEERALVEWQFVVEDDGAAIEVSGTSTTATGPKSKAFRWLTALVGAANIKPGARITPAELVGREAMVTIGANKNGWPKVDDVTAIPKGRR